MGHRGQVGGRARLGRGREHREAGRVDLHPLPAGVRDHVGAVGDRGGRRRGAGPPSAASGRRGRMTVDPGWYLTLAAALFTIGAVGLLIRRNVLIMFMCIELMLNAVNLTFVTDRKSTRLNSSHGYISYAVFCLKKKSTKRE